MTASIRRATSLRPGQLKHLIRVASVTGRLPERDVMPPAHTHHWHSRHRAGLAGGRRRAVSQRSHQVRGVFTRRHHQGLPRNVYLTHPRCLAALDGWIAVRLRRRWGLSGTDDDRGLRPGSKLVTTHKGQAFEQALKHRELDSGPEVYRACDSLQQAISRLYRQAGIKQGSSHSADAPWRPRC